MFKRLLFSIVISILLVGSLQAGTRYTPEQMRQFAQLSYTTKMVGDVIYSERVDKKIISNGLYAIAPAITQLGARTNLQYSVQGADFTGNVTMRQITGNTNETGATWYDLQGNGAAHQIWQNPGNFDEIAMAYTWSSDTTNTWPTRTVRNYISTNRGVNWTEVGDVPTPGPRSGFPAITGVPGASGMPVIAFHTNAGGTTTHTQVFVDPVMGLGSWTRLDPGQASGVDAIWPRISVTTNQAGANKFVVLSSQNVTTPPFFGGRNTGTDLNTSAFLGWNAVPNMDNAETYAVANGDGNRIGIAYLTADGPSPNSVFFMESLDGGSTFGAATQIFTPQFGADTVAPIRGVSIVYQGASPKVAFEICPQTLNIPNPTYSPGLPNRIMFWSDNLPGANPNKCIPIFYTDTLNAGPNSVPFAPSGGINDVFVPVCRPVLGTSGSALFVAAQVCTDSTDVFVWNAGADTAATPYRALYLTASGNNGLSWKRPVKITPTGGANTDYCWPSMSMRNDESAGSYFVNMTVQGRSRAGSNVNSVGSTTNFIPRPWILNTMHYIRVEIPKPVLIENISSVAKGFSLAQNFPNPFNPSTSIRFALPTKSNVMLKIYDISGKEVATLINNEVVSAGLNEVTFNGVNLASGVYFYSITAGNFKDTKKMMLIK